MSQSKPNSNEFELIPLDLNDNEEQSSQNQNQNQHEQQKDLLINFSENTSKITSRTVGEPQNFSENQIKFSEDYMGKYTPFFRGYFVLGPNKCAFIGNLMILLLIGLMWGFQYRQVKNYFGLDLIVFVTSVYCLAVSFFILTCTRDPGVSPKDFEGPETETECGSRENSVYCSKCKAHRKPRTYHCQHCNICIRKKDTHFVMGGICVGERNHREFLFMIVLFLILAVCLILINVMLIPLVVLDLNGNPTDETAHKFYCKREFYLDVTLLICGLILLFLPQTGLHTFSIRVFLLAKGLTYFEYEKAGEAGPLINLQGNPGILINFAKFIFNRPVRQPSCFSSKKFQDEQTLRENSLLNKNFIRSKVDFSKIIGSNPAADDFELSPEFKLTQPISASTTKKPNRKYFALLEDDWDDSSEILWQKTGLKEINRNGQQGQFDFGFIDEPEVTTTCTYTDANKNILKPLSVSLHRNEEKEKNLTGNEAILRQMSII